MRKLSQTKLRGILDLSQDDPDYGKYTFDDNDNLVIKTSSSGGGGNHNVRTNTNKNGTKATTTTSANVAPPLGRVPSYKSMMETITGNKVECWADGKGTNCHIIKHHPTNAKKKVQKNDRD